jgi:hypothetical protein
LAYKRDRVAGIDNVFDSVYYFDDIVFGRSFPRITVKFRGMVGNFCDYLVDTANLFITSGVRRVTNTLSFRSGMK